MTPFFVSSKAFHTQLTGLYDLINPTAAAMWNLRWQVKGYVDERAAADNRELHGRFVAGSGIGSANLRRHCIERTWEDQVGELALLGMFGAIGLYEGWIAALEVGNEQQRRRLQFPSRGVAGRTTLGVRDIIAVLQVASSPLLERAYGQTLRSAPRYMPDRLDDMLLCYRCFKEIRNVAAHAGRIPDQQALDAYDNALPCGGGLGKGGRNIDLLPVLPGEPVRISLLNVQALCALLLNIVMTIDADLAVTRPAEVVLLNRWRSVRRFSEIPVEPVRRQTRLRVLNNKVGYPVLNDEKALYTLLRTANLVM